MQQIQILRAPSNQHSKYAFNITCIFPITYGSKASRNFVLFLGTCVVHFGWIPPNWVEQIMPSHQSYLKSWSREFLFFSFFFLSVAFRDFVNSHLLHSGTLHSHLKTKKCQMADLKCEWKGHPIMEEFKRTFFSCVTFKGEIEEDLFFCCSSAAKGKKINPTR